MEAGSFQQFKYMQCNQCSLIPELMIFMNRFFQRIKTCSTTSAVWDSEQMTFMSCIFQQIRNMLCNHCSLIPEQINFPWIENIQTCKNIYSKNVTGNVNHSADTLKYVMFFLYCLLYTMANYYYIYRTGKECNRNGN